MMNRAVVALGSNIEPRKNIKAALEALTKYFSLIKKSSFTFTEPIGYKEQPDFLNGAVLLEMPDDKSKIETIFKKIEADLGRQRTGRKNGPRKIDLDLIVFNEQIVDNDVFKRDFLKKYLCELLPNLEVTE